MNIANWLIPGSEYSKEGIQLKANRRNLLGRPEPFWRKLKDHFFLGYQKWTGESYYPEFWWSKLVFNDRIKYFRVGRHDTYEEARNSAEKLLIDFIAGNKKESAIRTRKGLGPIFYSAREHLAESYAKHLECPAKATKVGEVWIVELTPSAGQVNKNNEMRQEIDNELETFSRNFYAKGSRLLAIQGVHFFFDAWSRCSTIECIPLFNLQFKSHRIFSTARLIEIFNEGGLIEISSDNPAFHEAESIYKEAARPGLEESEAKVRYILQAKVKSETKAYSHENLVLNHFSRVEYQKRAADRFSWRHSAGYYGLFPSYDIQEFDKESSSDVDRPDEWRYNFRGTRECNVCGTKMLPKAFRCASCLAEVCYRCGNCCGSPFANKDVFRDRDALD